jgi:hypothetical protein
MMQVVFLDSDSDSISEVPATSPRQNGEQSALVGRQGVVQGEGGAGQVQSELGIGRVKECGAGVWFANVMQGNCGAYECGAGRKWCIRVWYSVVQGNSGAVWYRPDVVQVQTRVGISQMSM